MILPSGSGNFSSPHFFIKIKKLISVAQYFTCHFYIKAAEHFIVCLKGWFVVQNLKIAESRVFILKAFRLRLFKRIRQK